MCHGEDLPPKPSARAALCGVYASEAISCLGTGRRTKSVPKRENAVRRAAGGGTELNGSQGIHPVHMAMGLRSAQALLWDCPWDRLAHDRPAADPRQTLEHAGASLRLSPADGIAALAFRCSQTTTITRHWGHAMRFAPMWRWYMYTAWHMEGVSARRAPGAPLLCQVS